MALRKETGNDFGGGRRKSSGSLEKGRWGLSLPFIDFGNVKNMRLGL